MRLRFAKWYASLMMREIDFTENAFFVIGALGRSYAPSSAEALLLRREKGAV